MRKIITIVAALLAIGLATACDIETEPAPVQTAGKGGGESFPVKLTAKRAEGKRTMLASEPLSCVKVKITNQQKDASVEINPLYFSITDTDGTKHDTSMALGEYEGQVPTTTLAPGENAKGVVCARGKFTPKQVTMTNEIFDEAARAEVAA